MCQSDRSPKMSSTYRNRANLRSVTGTGGLRAPDAATGTSSTRAIHPPALVEPPDSPQVSRSPDDIGVDYNLPVTPAMWDSRLVTTQLKGNPVHTYRRQPQSVGHLLDVLDPDDASIYLVQGSRRISIGEFARAVDVCAERFERAGVRPGESVMLYSENSPEWAVSLWAAWRVGAVAILANRWWPVDELKRACERFSPKAVVTDVPLELPNFGGFEVIETSGLLGLTRRPWTTDRPPPVGPDADAVVIFTSGSTSTPNAVVLSHRSVLTNVQNLLVRAERSPGNYQADGSNIVRLITVPLFHVGGPSSLVLSLVVRATVVLAPGRFDPDVVLDLMESEHVSTWGAVPTMVSRVLSRLEESPRDLKALRSITIGGAPISTELLERVQTSLPHVTDGLTVSWGLSESGGYLTMASGPELWEHPGTVGQQLPSVELTVRNPNTAGIGELLARTPTLMSRYLGNLAQPINNEGWLATGDVGRIDAGGYVYLAGRAKDIVIRGGENVACPRVEAILATHPAVVEVSVLGVPHGELGEEVAAVIVQRRGTFTTPAQLREFAASHLAHFEVPSKWLIQAEPLPVLPTGKVDQLALLSKFTSKG